MICRAESAAAIQQCKEAGIKVSFLPIFQKFYVMNSGVWQVFVITGDHPTTAKSLAMQIGLISDVPVSAMRKFGGKRLLKNFSLNFFVLKQCYNYADASINLTIAICYCDINDQLCH